MKNSCKGVCTNYKTLKRYINGAVRCRTCYVFIKWKGLWCPCCGCRISGRARGSRSKSLQIKIDNAKRL